MDAVQVVAMDDCEWEPAGDGVWSRAVHGAAMTCTRYRFEPGARFPLHEHEQEQITYVTRGRLTFRLPEGEHVVDAEGAVVVPPWVPHTAQAGPDGADLLSFVSPARASESGIRILE